MNASRVENVTAMQGFNLSTRPEHLEANRAADFFLLSLDLLLLARSEAVLSAVCLPSFGCRFPLALMSHTHGAFISLRCFFELERWNGVNDILDFVLVRDRFAIGV